MSTTIRDLKSVLESLSTERIERLVNRLEDDPGALVTVGSWRPQCPMVLAGFEPLNSAPDAPEQRFASVWDEFASTNRHGWRALLALMGERGRTARRCDVQALLRTANSVLAARQSANARRLRAPAAKAASSPSWTTRSGCPAPALPPAPCAAAGGSRLKGSGRSSALLGATPAASVNPETSTRTFLSGCACRLGARLRSWARARPIRVGARNANRASSL